ncbi:Leucine rich repeat 4 [Dillenia turbinata]|uniref:Leucine rich repeat 4 n=1 Tax=Dillenia turbinata TaxID=194707 RepID=A0AAN8WE52_9MAGN
MEDEDKEAIKGDSIDEELSSSPTLLDLSSFQLRDLDGVELPSTLIELDLTANRLSALDSRIGLLSRLKKLSLRQNLIDDAGVSPISQWDAISGLEELVLRDNKLMKIPDMSIFKCLLVFDISFNEISSLHGLSKVSNTLMELYVSKNEVTKMEDIEHFPELRILELGSNRLRVMENLQNFTNLQELWLGRNRIKAVNLCGLTCIKKISLQSNRLTSMTGFEGCVALEELYLSHNGIAKMEGLSALINLRVLDVSANKLISVDDIQNLSQLEDLWLNDNQISSLGTLSEAVAGSREKLTTVYLERNPCVCLSSHCFYTDYYVRIAANSPNYFATIRQFFPKIQQIDSEIFA